MFCTTQEIPISQELLDRIFPPRRRESEPPVSIHELAIDTIQAAELRAGLADTQEMPVVRT